MPEVEDRVWRLERTLGRIIGGGIVLAVVILAFLGVTSFYQIPTQITKAISAYIEREEPRFGEKVKGILADTERAAEQAKESAAEIEAIENDLGSRGVLVQTGMVSMDQKSHPHIWNVDRGHCPPWAEGGRRGMLDEYVKFPKPFLAPPKVLMALNIIDTGHDGRPVRLFMDVKNVSEEGFHYNLFTSCNSKVNWVRASWIAVAE